MRALLISAISIAFMAGCAGSPTSYESCQSALTDDQKQAMFSQTPTGSAGFGSGRAYGNRDLGENL